MGEYIERETLLDELEFDFNSDWDKYDNSDKDYKDGVRDEYDDMLKIICQQKAADVQPTDRWISVKEKYPKFNQRVLVITKDRLYKGSPIRLGCLCISLQGYETWWEIDGGECYEDMDIVTHWCPLPELPKADE